MENLENFFFKQARLAGTFSQDHPALILNFKSLAFNPLSWPGTLHHLFWGFVITESTCRVLQHFKLSVDKNQNNYNFHKLRTAIQALQPHLAPIFHKYRQQEHFSCRRVFCSFCHQTAGQPQGPWAAGHQLCPQDAPPALGPGQALLDATTGGTVTEEHENGLFQQPNLSDMRWQAGMAIPAHACHSGWATFHIQKVPPPHSWVGINDFLPY